MPETRLKPTRRPALLQCVKLAALLSTLFTASCATIGPVERQKRNVICEIAGQMLNVKYSHGGNSPSEGFDCSGLVQYVFAKAGVSVPRTSAAQHDAARRISKSSLMPGDLVFFSTGKSGVSHVGIYIGGNQFIHAPSSGKKIRIDHMRDAYWRRTYHSAGSFF